jgi:hypothetical protein
VGRKLAVCWIAVVGLGVPGLASASPAGSQVSGTQSRLGRPLASGEVTGRVVYIDGSSFIVRTAGRAKGVVHALTVAANRITRHNYPYVYGGGHSHAGKPSRGMGGTGHKGHRVGYDCSGSVAAVLAAGRLWRPGSGVPSEAGMIKELRARHMIAPGAGKGPVQVTLYDDPGVHIFMNIDGRFFGTSAGGPPGDRAGGPGWLGTSAPDATTSWYKRYHFVSRVLKGSTKSGQNVTFRLTGRPSFAALLARGANVRVSYEETQVGTMMATGVTYAKTKTVTGTVTTLAPDASSFTIQKTGGGSMTLAAGEATDAVRSLLVGASVSVSYARTKAGPVALELTLTAPPPPAAP